MKRLLVDKIFKCGKTGALYSLRDLIRIYGDQPEIILFMDEETKKKFSEWLAEYL